MSEMKEALGETERAIDSMSTLALVNAAGFCLFPSGIIALRSALGSPNPAVVAGPTAVAGLAATVGSLFAYKALGSKERMEK
jgi:spore maturation protein A